MYVVILAGGAGTRLWPLSRRSQPKQFLAFISTRSMLQDTYQRVSPVTSPEQVWVVTGADFAELARSQLPEVPPENVLAEPVGRSSAPAAALAAARIARRDPGAIVLVTPADSYIGDPAVYIDYLAIAREAAERRFIVTLGVIPTHPDTGLGYIKRGEHLPGIGGAYRVQRFTEKPDRATATRYVADGGYYWNMGQFVVQAGHFMERCAAHLPEVAQAASHLAEQEALSLDEIGRWYAELPTISLDYGIAERERDMAVVPTAVEWSDLGNWRAVKEITARRGAVVPSAGDHISLDEDGCFVLGRSGRLVVTIGAQGLVVVDTPDALLIVHEDRAQEVKEALEEIEARGREEWL